MILVPPPLNNWVINPSQISSVRQQWSISSQKIPCDNRWFNSKDSNSKSNELSSLVIPVPPPFNYLVINPPQLSLVSQQSSSTSHNTKPDLQTSSIPFWTSLDLSNTMPLPSTMNGGHNIYGCMVDVSKLTPAKRQHRTFLLLQHYHELCNMIDHSSMSVSPSPIPNIESLCQSTILSLDSGQFGRFFSVIICIFLTRNEIACKPFQKYLITLKPNLEYINLKHVKTLSVAVTFFIYLLKVIHWATCKRKIVIPSPLILLAHGVVTGATTSTWN